MLLRRPRGESTKVAHRTMARCLPSVSRCCRIAGRTGDLLVAILGDHEATICLRRNKAPIDTTALSCSLSLTLAFTYRNSIYTEISLHAVILRSTILMDSRRHSAYWWALVAAVFAACSSTFLFVIASCYRRWLWVELIGNRNLLDVSTAKVFVQLLAKLVEMAFVASHIAVLGQVFSRQASRRDPKSTVRLADLAMRDWVNLPGSMFSRRASFGSCCCSFFGVLTVATTILSIVYGTAASALGNIMSFCQTPFMADLNLVAPIISSLPEQHETFTAAVSAKYASLDHLRRTCPTPINATLPPDSYDNEGVGNLCLSIAWAAQSQASNYGLAARWTEQLRANLSVSRSSNGSPIGF